MLLLTEYSAMQNIRYFDNAATTLIRKEALDAYNNTALEYMGNPSANHREGFKAHTLLEDCRKSIALHLNAKPEQIFFTSGATEAISIVFASLLWAKTPGEVIVSAIEHEAVLSWASILKEKGWNFRTIKAKGGFVNPEELKAMISRETKLIAVQAVNNVTGAIQDIPALVKAVREKEAELGRKIFFFSDSVQALGKIDLDLKKLDIDGASFSAHKISGPRGIGALYLKKGDIQSLAKAGGQEKGVRGGTENLPAIKAFETALDLCAASANDVKEIYDSVRSLLEDAGIKVLSPKENTSPFILSITTPLPAEVMTRMLIDEGFCVSSGSACSNNAKGKGEGVILAMGYTARDAAGTIRISFCHESNKEEAENLAKTIISKVRSFK